MNVKELENLRIKCRELEDCPMYNRGTFNYGTYEGKSPVNNRAAEYAGTFGIQQVMNVFRKMYGWHVFKNEWHSDTKSFDVSLIENNKVKEVRHISYEEICKTMWWHSFEIIAPDTLKPDAFTFEEREAVESAKK